MLASILVAAFAAGVLAGPAGPVNVPGPSAVPSVTVGTSALPSSSCSTSTSTSSAASSTPTDYISKTLYAHNVHRANHTGTYGVVWNDTMAAMAQQIANSCTFAHQMGVNGLAYGQNIAAGVKDVGAVISNLFYNGEVNYFAPYYGEDAPGGNFETYGHFTQVVWKGSHSVGCATAYCPGNGTWANPTGNWLYIPPYYTVCNYFPPGNIWGDFADNVGAPLNLPTVSG